MKVGAHGPGDAPDGVPHLLPTSAVPAFGAHVAALRNGPRRRQAVLIWPPVRQRT